MGSQVRIPDYFGDGVPVLGLDEALLHISNQLTNNLTICSHSNRCIDCDDICHTLLNPFQNVSLIFSTLSPNNIVVKSTPFDDRLNDTIICQELRDFKDQSLWNLTIQKESENARPACVFQLLSEGRNNYIPIWVMVSVYILLAFLFYTASFAWKSYILKFQSRLISSYSSVSQQSTTGGSTTPQVIANQSSKGRSRFLRAFSHDGSSVVHPRHRRQLLTSTSHTDESSPTMPTIEEGSDSKQSVGPSTSSTIEDDRTSRDSSSSTEEREKSTVNVPAEVAEQELQKSLRSHSRSRVVSLDAFRGVVILLMIFVNVGGGGYSFFNHIPWFGLTIADVIFPSFVFIMGMSTALSIRNRLMERKDFVKIGWKIVTRSFKLFALGIMLNTDNTPLSEIRIPGVLQRFAVSYAVVAFLHLLSVYRGNRYLAGLSPEEPSLSQVILIYLPEGIVHFLLLVVYLYFTLFFSYGDGCPPGYQGPGGHHIQSKYINCTGGAANYLDRITFGDKHIYHGATSKKVFGHSLDHDPEGLLGFTTSILLTEIGLICGRIIIKERSHYGRLTRWAIIGIVCGLLGIALSALGVNDFGHGVIPIIKNLWSLSFILVCGFLSIGGFLIMYILVDVTDIWRNGFPFHFPGSNAILLYVGHEVCSRFFPFYFDVDESSHAWLLFRSAWNASLWLLVSVYFYHKKLFWKL